MVLGQSEHRVRDVGPVVVLARNLTHQLVQLAPLVHVLLVLRVHVETSVAAQQVVVEGGLVGQTAGQVVEGHDVAEVESALDGVTEDAVVPLAEDGHTVFDAHEGGGKVGEVLLVVLVSRKRREPG